jgi:cytochrome c oxidase subunit 1
MFVNILYGTWKGKPAEDNPWGGETLEWKIQAPLPHENFEEEPTVTAGPYEFSDKGRGNAC